MATPHDNDNFMSEPYAVHWHLWCPTRQPVPYCIMVDTLAKARREVEQAAQQGVYAWYVRMPA